jgi:hypothetical protein
MSVWQSAFVVGGILAFVWAMVRTRYPDILLLVALVVIVVVAVAA